MRRSHFHALSIAVLSALLLAVLWVQANERQKAPLRSAIDRLDVAAVDAMLKRKSELADLPLGRTPGGDERMPLHLSLEASRRDSAQESERRLEIVKLLVANGADIHRVDGYGYNYLYYAASIPDPRLTRFLLFEGVRPYTGREHSNERPVVKLAKMGNRGVLAEYAEVADRGMPDIHFYCAMGDVATVKGMLRQDPALQSSQDITGRYPFDYANAQGDAKLKQLLR